MAKYQLGEFEEVVLLTVGVLYNEAYGVAIKKETEGRLNRKVTVGALQSALKRLENKGFLSSREGPSNLKRGGRPKRYFTITAYGKQAIEYNREVRNQLYNAIPKIAFDLNIG